LPDNWKNLTTDKYDGSTNPDEHIAVYTVGFNSAKVQEGG